MEKWKKSEFQNTCVKIEHVTKRFGEDLVLKEVNLTLKVGQVYGVVGNNGSGKTVLMKCICGFLQSISGGLYLGQCFLRGLLRGVFLRYVGSCGFGCGVLLAIISLHQLGIAAVLNTCIICQPVAACRIGCRRAQTGKQK